MRSGGGASKRQLALLTYVGKDIPDMCSLFFRFYTGYHQLARRDIFVVQMGSSLDACLLRYRPTILRSDSSERPFLERTKLTWLQEGQHKLLQKYVYVLIADLDEFFLPDPARYANLPDYLSKRETILARHSASPSNASSSFPAVPFVAPVGYEIMARSPSEESFNWSLPVLRQRTRWARLCGMAACSKCLLGSARGRLLRLFRSRLAAPGGYRHPDREAKSLGAQPLPFVLMPSFYRRRFHCL
jgi:hypothetical protein|tara:strand:+ start:33 stop:764 length:732 start_codon:yes stop_codon:yes gene_type:complete